MAEYIVCVRACFFLVCVCRVFLRVISPKHEMFSWNSKSSVVQFVLFSWEDQGDNIENTIACNHEVCRYLLQPLDEDKLLQKSACLVEKK